MFARSAADDGDGRSRRFWALVAVVGLGLQIVLVVGVGAFVSAFFLGLGGPPETTPMASFSGDAGPEYVLTHEGGDGLGAANVSVLRNGEEVGTWAELSTDTDATDEVTAGHQVVVPNVEAGDTITVVWHGADDAATIFEEEVYATRTRVPTSKTTAAPVSSSNETGTTQGYSKGTGTP